VRSLGSDAIFAVYSNDERCRKTAGTGCHLATSHTRLGLVFFSHCIKPGNTRYTPLDNKIRTVHRCKYNN